MKIRVLGDGYFKLDKSYLVYTKYMGTTYRACFNILYVETDGERILIDTGIGELPEKYRRFYPVERRPGDALEAQLKSIGVEPGRITIVINTHLHFDHCGNNKLFKNATFLVQVDELRYAYYPDRFMKGGYIREQFDLPYASIEPLYGYREIAEGIEVIPTPGHTPGHQSVVLTRDDGVQIVFCGDAAPLSENLERENIPGIVYSPVSALESIKLLKQLNADMYVHPHEPIPTDKLKSIEQG